jgi:hypothetical protein
MNEKTIWLFAVVFSAWVISLASGCATKPCVCEKDHAQVMRSMGLSLDAEKCRRSK